MPIKTSAECWRQRFFDIRVVSAEAILTSKQSHDALLESIMALVNETGDAQLISSVAELITESKKGDCPATALLEKQE